MSADQPRPSEPVDNRRLHRKAPTLPHPFEPSGRLVGRSRVEACDACGLAQRGAGSMHPEQEEGNRA